MSCATTIDELKSFVEKIMRERGILKYEIQIDGHSGRGENYLGEVTFFTVTPTENGQKYNLVMKTAKRSEELRMALGVENAYKRESMMYSEVFPEISRFLEKTSSEDKVLKIDFVPKIYWICDVPNRETLVMENVKTRGFRHWNRRLPMDMNHALFVLKHLGKYHATTMAMKMLRPESFKKLTQNMKGIWQEFMKKMDGDALFGSLFHNAMSYLEENGRGDLAGKFKAVEDKIHSITQEEIPNEDKLVITHGDCWMNNILLKYEKEGSTTPSEICFVDFQLSSHDSSVKDLSYFIYSACDGAILADFDLLLLKYHSALRENLHALGCNVDDIFPYSRLVEHWKKYGTFGLIMSLMIVKVELLDEDEAPDIKEISENGANFADSFSRVFRSEQIYKKRVLEILEHFGKSFL